MKIEEASPSSWGACMQSLLALHLLRRFFPRHFCLLALYLRSGWTRGKKHISALDLEPNPQICQSFILLDRFRGLKITYEPPLTEIGRKRQEKHEFYACWDKTIIKIRPLRWETLLRPISIIYLSPLPPAPTFR